MSRVFVIAEAATTWMHGGLEAAYRSIRAAKECDADAWKTQWTSDPLLMAQRRYKADNLDIRTLAIQEMAEKYKRLAWPREWLPLLKAECDRVGIEFMTTVFIPKDIETIAPFVKRFKVSAFEGMDSAFILVHQQYDKEIIRSTNDKDHVFQSSIPTVVRTLWCVSKYPTPIDEIKIQNLGEYRWSEDESKRDDIPLMVFDGLSDHTTSVLTGAVAVGAGARIIEKHVRLSDTTKDDPDYGHSLICDDVLRVYDDGHGTAHLLGDTWNPFKDYVRNIREAELML